MVLGSGCVTSTFGLSLAIFGGIRLSGAVFLIVSVVGTVATYFDVKILANLWSAFNCS